MGCSMYWGTVKWFGTGMGRFYKLWHTNIFGGRGWSASIHLMYTNMVLRQSLAVFMYWVTVTGFGTEMGCFYILWYSNRVLGLGVRLFLYTGIP